MKRIVLFVLAALFSVSTAFAQLPTAVALGVVKDSTGALIRGAKVVINNVDTAQARTVSTGDDGSYRVDALPVGNYKVTVEMTGFKSEVQTGLNLTVGQEAVVNFSLQAGDETQSVDVTAEAPLVSTTTSSLGGLVDEHRIAELPLNGRNYVDLTLLQPGVSQSPSSTSTAIGFAGTAFSSNGAPIRSNNYMLDGAILGNLLGVSGASAIGTTLGVDGILEYKVITNAITADYGLSMGSQTTIVSKSGSNTFHGNVFEYIRNSVLDARNYFDLPPSKIGHRLPEFRRNNYGASLGGPIKKNKAFLYLTYEGLSSSLGATLTSNVVGVNCHGNVGDVITVAACPQLTSNVTILPVIKPFLDLYPLPNIGASQYGYSQAQVTSESYGQVRYDQTISNSDTAFIRYTIDQADQTSPFSYPQFSTVLGSRGQFLTMAENHVFSSALLNSARFSASRSPIALTSPTNLTGPQYSFVTGQPIGALQVTGLTVMGTYQNSPRQLKQNVFTWSDDLIYTHGRHSLKFGFTVNHYQDFIDAEGFNKGIAQYADITHFFNNQMQTYQEVLPGSLLGRYFHFDTFGFYAMDDWRVTPKLTLNMGIRYEPTTQVQEVHGIQAGLPHPLTDPTNTLGSPYFKNSTLRNFGPRFGFAYDISGNGKMAIRGGYGILYDLQTYGTVLMLGAGYDSPFATVFTTPTNLGGALTVPYVIPAGDPILQSYRGPVYNMNQPHAMQYNLTFERQFPGAIALSLSYAGSRGINLLQIREGNPIIPTGVPTAGDAACVAPPAGTVIDLTSQTFGSATSCYRAATAAVVGPPAVPAYAGDQRINPAYGSMVVGGANGSSNYNSLQANVNKHLSNGIQFQSSYTYSKVLDYEQDQNGDGGSSPVDPLHEGPSYGPADFNTKHNWRFNALYHIPKMNISNRALGTTLNGWWASGIVAVQSGYPFGAYESGNRSQDGQLAGLGSNQDRPNVNAGRNNSNIIHGTSAGCGTGATRAANGTAIAAGTPLGTPSLWFDPCAFTIQPSGFLGTSARNILVGPGLLSVNTSLVKDTRVSFLGEQGDIQFRAEVFNILNHTNFSLPGTAAYAGTASVQNPVSTAGVITTTSTTSRQIQFALKISF